MRKAIHKQTGISRAIKIISKEKATKEEQYQPLNEMQILTEIVSLFFFSKIKVQKKYTLGSS